MAQRRRHTDIKALAVRLEQNSRQRTRGNTGGPYTRHTHLARVWLVSLFILLIAVACAGAIGEL